MRTSLVVLAPLALLLAGCGDDSTGPSRGGPPVTTTLTCIDGAPCELDLGANTKFTITLNSVSCEAANNRVSVTKPVQQQLTDDGCFEPAGRVWTFNGPYEAPNNKIGLAVVSPQLGSPPVLRVTGATPTWTVEFEDGADSDFNDMIFTIRAMP